MTKKGKIPLASTGMREMEVGTLLLGNDENNVIPDKALSYF